MTAELPRNEPVWSGTGRKTVVVLVWMFCSALMIHSNKWVLRSFGFRHPIYLTFVQSTGISLALAMYNRLSGRTNPISAVDRASFLQYVLPIACMLTASIVLRNYVYLFLSIAAMQLLASAAPVVVFIVTCLMGHERLTPQLAAAICTVCFGVALACKGEVVAAWQGVVMQVTAMVLEGVRAVRLKKFINATDMTLDSLGMLSLLSPVSAALLYVPAAITDFEAVLEYTLANGWIVHVALMCNVAVAFVLNIAALQMLREVSVITASLSGVCKDCLIIWSSLLQGDGQLRASDCLGWLISVIGMCYYTWVRNVG